MLRFYGLFIQLLFFAAAVVALANDEIILGIFSLLCSIFINNIFKGIEK